MVFQFKLPSFMKIHLVFHVSLLEPYHASTILRRICDPLPPIEVDGKQEYEMENILDSNTSNHQLQYLVISMGMMWVNTFVNQWKTYQMPWKGFMNFINDIQTNVNSLLMEFIVRRGGDVTNANAIGFIHLNVHSWLIINLYLTLSLVSIHS